MGFALSAMSLSSSAFEQGGDIPEKYTGEGADVSPPLSWADAPEGTKAFAVICHDPDAPLVSPVGTYGFGHWALYNIPADVNGLEEATGAYTSGTSDFGKPGYGGPMPPPGHGKHQYYFWVLALSEALELEAGLSIMDLLRRVEPSLIGMNRLVGVYQRS
ncbi:MAG: YbhB/YbcL family Raf kinase inhibitor-like protein [Pseudomonadales bacterium]|nr:YbhB/YbcL family Raf kinase inhibitor-like protein [Pseudomonadales bacterium]